MVSTDMCNKFIVAECVIYITDKQIITAIIPIKDSH